MGIYGIKPAFQKFLRPSLKLLRPFHPDILTWTALLFSVFVGLALFFAVEIPVFFLVVIPLLFLRIALNALDGMLAKETGRARPQGEVLNEVLDRIGDVFILIGISLSSLCRLELGLVAIPFVLVASYTGILGKAVGCKRQYCGILGKADRLILIMIFSLAQFMVSALEVELPLALSLFDWLLLIFIIGAVTTIFQRVSSIFRELKQR